MAIREQAPRTQRRERKRTPDATSIASHVAGVVNNLQRDRQAIQNPFELRRRADMAMVAMLEVVAPVLPQIVQEQVQQLISIHDAFYKDATPSAEQQVQEGDEYGRRRDCSRHRQSRTVHDGFSSHGSSVYGHP